MKKLILLLIIVSVCAFSEEKEVVVNTEKLDINSNENEILIDNLSPVTLENTIGILFVEGDFDSVKNLMQEYPQKESYFYFYTLGNLAYEEGKKEEALKYFNKALSYEKTNIGLNLDILKIYLEDKNYQKEVENKFSFLEKQNLTEKEKKQLKELKTIFNNFYKTKSSNRLELGITYDSNKNFDTDKKTDFYSSQSYTYLGSKELKNGSIEAIGSVTNKLKINSDGSEGISLFLGAEYFTQYKKIDYSIPLYFGYDNSNKQIDISTGLNYDKSFKDKQILNTGVSMKLLHNDNYGGMDLGMFVNYRFTSFINYTVFGKAGINLYNKDIYEQSKASVSLSLDKVLLEKYFVYGKYTYELSSSNYTATGATKKRYDMINTIKIGYEQNIFRDDIKFGANYMFSYDLPNYKGYESAKNLINTSIKWEF